MTVLTVVGARPQFIKAAAVSRVLRRSVTERLLHTGQHYDAAMSDRFFGELDLPAPDYTLGVGSAAHGAQTAAMLCGVESVLLRDRPDRVLVYGDTNSTIAGALAAAKLGIPVVHVEAGLRSFDRSMPEELNRVVTDHLASLLCCPGPRSVENLAAEGIVAGVHETGDVMLDLLDAFAPRVTGTILGALGLGAGRYLLLTLHRAGNTDDEERLRRILVPFTQADVPVVFPVHPRTRRAIAAAGTRLGGALRLIDPVGYGDMIALQRGARTVFTDSGGVQKEACWLGVPCVTLRRTTEWTETVDAGWNRLVDADVDRIAEAIGGVPVPSAAARLYGDGHAAERIAALVME